MSWPFYQGMSAVSPPWIRDLRREFWKDFLSHQGAERERETVSLGNTELNMSSHKICIWEMKGLYLSSDFTS